MPGYISHASDSPSSEQSPPPEPPQEQPPEPEPEDESVPDGTSKEVLKWVGDDKERAQAALDKENASNKPRSTLVDDLEKKLAE